MVAATIMFTYLVIHDAGKMAAETIMFTYTILKNSFLDADINRRRRNCVRCILQNCYISVSFPLYLLPWRGLQKEPHRAIFAHANILLPLCWSMQKSSLNDIYGVFSKCSVAKLLCNPSWWGGGGLSLIFVSKCIKGTVSRDKYFLWPIKLNQYFLYIRWWFLKFCLSLLLRKSNAK
jgi:hypothetical protein